MLLKPLVFLLGLIALICLALWFALWAARKWLQKRCGPEDRAARCVCGYSLQGLTLPRCPECGRAVGFDKTFEELGIARDELKKMK
jgi:hypothetical protein